MIAIIVVAAVLAYVAVAFAVNRRLYVLGEQAYRRGRVAPGWHRTGSYWGCAGLKVGRTNYDRCNCEYPVYMSIFWPWVLAAFVIVRVFKKVCRPEVKNIPEPSKLASLEKELNEL